MVSLGATAGAGFAAAMRGVGERLIVTTSVRSAPAQPSWRSATSQRGVAVAQAAQSPAPEPAGYSTLRRQEFANLGQLLNAGGKLLSTQQFKEELVQRRHARRYCPRARWSRSYMRHPE